jgi:hypothetical protein
MVFLPYENQITPPRLIMKEITKKIINRTVTISSYSFFILFGLAIFVIGFFFNLLPSIFQGPNTFELCRPFCTGYVHVMKEVQLVIFLIFVPIIWFTCKKINTSRIIKVSSVVILSPWIYLLITFLGTFVEPQYKHLLAKRGNAAMQFDLGWMYAIGHRVPSNRTESIKWYQLAAKKEHAIAQFALGVMHYDGDKVKENRKEALNLFQRSAENGIFESQLYLGWMYYHGIGVQKDDKKAFKWFKQALQEDRYSKDELLKKHWNLKHIYNYDDFSLLQRSENALGQIYARGRVTQQDYEEASKWYRRAAYKSYGRLKCTSDCGIDSIYTQAMYNLGLMYANGHGVSKDYVSAHMWWSMITDGPSSNIWPDILCVSNLISKNVRATTCTETNEYKLAMKRKKQLEITMTPEQIEKSKEMARNWKPKK